MKKFTFEQINCASDKINCFSFNLPNKIYNLKVVDAFIKLLVNSANELSDFRIDFQALTGENENFEVVDSWSNIDVVKVSSIGQEITINISDELQTAIDKKASHIALVFNGQNQNVTFDDKAIFGVEALSKAEYQQNGSEQTIDVGKAGKASVNLATGDFSANIPLFSNNEQAMPLSISANFNKAISENKPVDLLPENWHLNISQYLKQNEDTEKLAFTYIDENGKEQIIEESYTYTDKENNKVKVEPTELKVDVDGKLYYLDEESNEKYQITTTLEAPTGLKLISSLKDIEGSELVDYQPEELANVKANLENLEENIKSLEANIKQNKNQLILLAMSKNLLDTQNKSQKESIEFSKKAIQFEELYNKLHYNKKTIPQELESGTGVEYAKEFWNYHKGNIPQLYIEKILKFNDESVTDIPVTDKQGETRVLYSNDVKYLIKIIKDYYSGYATLGYDLSATKNGNLLNQKNNIKDTDELYNKIKSLDELQNIVGLFMGESKFITGANIREFYEKNQNFTLSLKDDLSLEAQKEALIFAGEDYQEKLKSYKKQHKKLKYQQEQLEMQVPVHYIYNENNIILGFGRTNNEKLFRLILIADANENMISIIYKDFDTNKIEKIIDSKEKVVTFVYNEDVLSSIIDTKDNKIEFEYKDGQVFSIKHIGEEKSYFYLKENELVLLNQSGLGCKFTFADDKVVKVEKLSVLSSIKNGKLKYKCFVDGVESESDSFDFENVVDFDNYKLEKEIIEFKYNNYKSTSVIDGMGKQLTYLFDKYGRAQTIYENNFNERDQENCTRVIEFEYKDEKVSEKLTPLIYSENYLADVCFDASTITIKDALTLGNAVCGTDTIPYKYKVCEKFHTIESSAQNKKDSVVISDDNLIKCNAPSCNHKIFILSGWAKADSAYITDEQDECSEYIKQRKFELQAEVTYNDNTTEFFHKSFDWRNTQWQYSALPIKLATDKIVTKLECFMDYSNNTGSISYTDLELKEGDYEINHFDTEDRLVQTIKAHSNFVTNYEYDTNSNRLIREVIENVDDQTKYVTQHYYTVDGKPLRTIDYNGVVNENVYNDKGEVVKSITYHKDQPSSKLYQEKLLDEKGNTTGELNTLGEQVCTYERDTHTDQIANTIDQDGNITSSAYSLDGKLLENSITVDGVENTNTFGYVYDYLTSLKHNGFEVMYDYDNQGRITKIDIGDNHKTQNYLKKEYSEYEEKTILATGEIFRQTYNKDGKVLDTYYRPSENQEEQHITQNIYNTYGELAFSKDVQKDEYIRNYFDKFGNTFKQVVDQHDKVITIQNSYDAEHDKIESSYFSFQDDFNRSSTTDELFYHYDYSKTPDKRLEAILLPNNLEQSIDYDKLGRVSSIITDNFAKSISYLKNGDHASNLISNLTFAHNGINTDSLSYCYDKKGNITEIRQNNILLARYKYDALSRLIREDNKPLNTTLTFSYDGGGNILTKCEYTFTLCENLDLLEGQTSNYKYSSHGWKDQLMQFNNQKFEYDSIGNPTIYRDIKLKWSHGRQLDKFGDIAEYKYNASGIRTSKVFDGFTTKFFLNGNKIIAQKDALNTMFFHYGADGLTGFSLNGTEYLYKKNAQNDIVSIQNLEGNDIVRYVYNAIGGTKTLYLSNLGEWLEISDNSLYNNTDEISRFIAQKNPFRYRSYYYDIETGLYYLNSRYYDPELGRFINADDVSMLDITKITLNGLNLYSYCLNNPINQVDENGDIPNWLKWLLGALVIVLAAALTVVSAGGFAAAGAAFAGALGIGSAAGGMTGFLAGVTIGAITAGAIGVVSGGISSVINGGSFWDGAADGFMWGVAGGALGGGFGALFNGVGTLFSISGRAVGSIPQIIGQSLIYTGTYIAQSYANGQKPTFIGIISTIFGAASGGALAYTPFLTQFTINVLSEGLKIALAGLKKMLDKLFNYNLRESGQFM